MPQFPTYHGELPNCLNLLNPHHYFLLIYWIFFRPTALRCYLYQADPELYKTGQGKKALFSTRHILAYRHLYLMAPITALFLGLLVTAPFPLIEHFIFGLPVDIFAWIFKLIKGVAFVMAFFVAFSMVDDVANGVVESIAKGVAFGVAYTVATVAFFVAFGVIFGVVVGVVMCVMVGAVEGVALGVVSGMVFAVLFGVIEGVAGSVAEGVAIGVAIGVLGALRAIFYPMQWLLSLLSLSGKIKHPLFWDEFIVLPLSDVRQILNQALQQDEQQGVCQLAQIMSNPFQRWLMQKILYKHLHKKEQPLHFTYNQILSNPFLNTYVFAPIKLEDWERIPNYRQLLLGELAGKWVKITQETPELLVWRLTNPFRERRNTPLTQFAALLYALYEQDRKLLRDLLNQTWAIDAYTNIHHYPNGEEIYLSFAAFTTFLNYQSITNLMNTPTIIADLPDPDTAIRPNVLNMLKHLGEIGAEVAIYQDSTSHVNKLSALARAADRLEELKADINTEINEPERYIFQAIIEHWQLLITEAGD